MARDDRLDALIGRKAEHDRQSAIKSLWPSPAQFTAANATNALEEEPYGTRLICWTSGVATPGLGAERQAIRSPFVAVRGSERGDASHDILRLRRNRRPQAILHHR